MVAKIYAVIAFLVLGLYYYAWAEGIQIVNAGGSGHSKPQGPGAHFHK